MIKVGVVGASGYTGLELIKIILKHPIFELSLVATSEGGGRVDTLHPSLASICNMSVIDANVEQIARGCELVFLALPHTASMGYVKDLVALGVKVVDLSADYRLDLKTYESYYVPHTDRENLKIAAYGLPELNQEQICESSLVANPGCYPTASLLAILPFMKYLQKDSPIIIDAKTGVSGSGKKLTNESHFVHINENVFAYKPFEHRHAPEIAQMLLVDESRVKFVPHLLPLTRGMLCSIYVSVDGDFDPVEVLREFYAKSPFVRIYEQPVSAKQSAGTNFCDIYATRSANTLFIASSIDNLLRGASSQAVVNANLMMGLDEDVGIPDIAYVP